MARMEAIMVPVDMTEVDRACDKLDCLLDKLKRAQALMDTLNRVKVPTVDPNTKYCPQCREAMRKDTSSCFTSYPVQYAYVCPSCGHQEIGL
jgi:predicted RNA-binding Zn-ribbon protein involved in translation (DUF1610 family)